MKVFFEVFESWQVTVALRQ